MKIQNSILLNCLLVLSFCNLNALSENTARTASLVTGIVSGAAAGYIYYNSQEKKQAPDNQTTEITETNAEHEADLDSDTLLQSGMVGLVAGLGVGFLTYHFLSSKVEFPNLGSFKVHMVEQRQDIRADAYKLYTAELQKLGLSDPVDEKLQLEIAKRLWDEHGFEQRWQNLRAFVSATVPQLPISSTKQQEVLANHLWHLDATRLGCLREEAKIEEMISAPYRRLNQ